jgi:hypothetical protein
MSVLEADHYREEEANLMLDPIIQQMAAEVTDDIDLDSWDFVQNALEEYQRRGGKNSKSIGGPARAIRALKS